MQKLVKPYQPIQGQIYTYDNNCHVYVDCAPGSPKPQRSCTGSYSCSSSPAGGFVYCQGTSTSPGSYYHC